MNSLICSANGIKSAGLKPLPVDMVKGIVFFHIHYRPMEGVHKVVYPLALMKKNSVIIM